MRQNLKFLFIRPGGYFVTTVFPDGPMISPPKGLLYLSAVLKKIPHVDVKILDALAYPDFALIEKQKSNPPFYFGMSLENIIKEIEEYDPDVIGISGLANYFLDACCELSKEIKSKFPKKFLCLGGPDPTADFESYYRKVPSIDCIFLAEGELSIKVFAEHLLNGTDWRTTKGIVYKNEEGKFIKTPSEQKIPAEEMDQYLPDYSQVDFDCYFRLNSMGYQSRISYHHPNVHKAIDIITSRGCPFMCSFCSIHLNFGRPFRSNSVEFVLNHMEELIEKHGIRHFHFEDDHISFDEKRFKSILRGIIQKGWKIVWDTPNGIRADTVDEELAELAVQSGCAFFIFGVESGSQRILDQVVNKSLKLDKVVNAAKVCNEAGIDTLAYYIIGFPGETKEEILQTYDFGIDLYKKYNCSPILQFWRPFVATDLEVVARENKALVNIDANEIYTKFKIPYTLFRDKVLGPDDYDIDFMAGIFQKYMKEVTRLSIISWLRVIGRNPLMFIKNVFEISFVTLRMLLNKRKRLETYQKYIYSKGLYPYAQLRKLGE
jgi:anaerobic magnesium-protoporphyrin IX monomethyl ester cyclase